MPRKDLGLPGVTATVAPAVTRKPTLRAPKPGGGASVKQGALFRQQPKGMVAPPLPVRVAGKPAIGGLGVYPAAPPITPITPTGVAGLSTRKKRY